jgi:hypothetical protein
VYRRLSYSFLGEGLGSTLSGRWSRSVCCCPSGASLTGGDYVHKRLAHHERPPPHPLPLPVHLYQLEGAARRVLYRGILYASGSCWLSGREVRAAMRASMRPTTSSSSGKSRMPDSSCTAPSYSAPLLLCLYSGVSSIAKPCWIVLNFLARALTARLSLARLSRAVRARAKKFNRLPRGALC